VNSGISFFCGKDLTQNEKWFLEKHYAEMEKEVLRLVSKGTPRDRIAIWAMGDTRYPDDYLVRAVDIEGAQQLLDEGRMPPGGPWVEEVWQLLLDTPPHGSPRLFLDYDGIPSILRLHLSQRTN